MMKEPGADPRLLFRLGGSRDGGEQRAQHERHENEREAPP